MANEFRVKNGIISASIATDSGDFTIDSAADVIIDADGADIILKDGGTEFGRFKRDSSDFVIKSATSDKDIIFKGNDAGSTITALTLDMSAAGAATFNDKITAVGTSVFTNLDISGDVDIDGTLETDALTVGGTTALIGGAQTAITTDYSTSRKVGRDAHNLIDFTTDNKITFRASNSDQLELTDNSLQPSSDNSLELGDTGTRLKSLVVAASAGANEYFAVGTANNANNMAMVRAAATPKFELFTWEDAETTNATRVSMKAFHNSSGTHGMILKSEITVNTSSYAGQSSEYYTTAGPIQFQGHDDTYGFWAPISAPSSGQMGALLIAKTDYRSELSGVGTPPQSQLEVRSPAGAPGTLTLSTEEATVVDGDKLGRIDFNAPKETGTDAIEIAASIWAEADDTFAADNNATDLVFATGASEAATEKFRITHEGHLVPSTDDASDLGTSTLQFKDGYFDGTLEADAITIGGTAIASVLSPVAGHASIATVGTIGTGTWQGTAIASAYLDSDTAHLSTTQTFSGAKTFSANATLAGFVLDGNTITGVDDSGEFTNNDAHIMTSAAIEDKITGYGYSTSDTTYSAGTNISLSSTTFNVDDAFLVNDANDTTTGTITAAGFTTTGVGSFGSLDISGNIDVDGTTNLDAVDIDGNVQLDGSLIVGIDDTGYDVSFFGATSGAYMMWDASADDLILGGSARLQFDSADTYIYADSDSSEDLHIGADGHIELEPDNDLIVKVGTTEYVRFDGSEKSVGIGTSSPAETLHVAVASGESGPIAKFERESNASVFIGGGNAWGNIWTDDTVLAFGVSGDYGADAQMRLWVNSDTAADAYSVLELKGNGDNYTNAGISLLALDDDASYRGLGVFMHDAQSDHEWYMGTPYSLADSWMVGRKGSVSSHTQSTSDDANAFLIVRNDGKVGIGTASPQTLFEVRGAAGSPGHVTLSTAETTVVDGDKLGRIDFNAPLEASGTDAILVGASIWAEADDTFAAGNNDTDLIFATGSTAAAAEKMRLDSTGNLLVGVDDCSVTSANHVTIEVGGATQANFRATDTSGSLYTDFAHSGNDTWIMNRVAAGKIYIKPGNGDHSIELASDGQVKFNNAYTFPTADGSANQVLMTDGSDTLSFTTLDISSHTNLAVSSPITLTGDTVGLDDPANLSALTESTDATSDKILLWDESGSSWKYMTLDNLQDSIDTTGGGGSGISDIVEDTTPQLGGNLDTNSHNILIDDDHGLLDVNGEEVLLFGATSSANSYIKIWNGISDSTSGTLFGTDSTGSSTTGGGRMTGPGLEAVGSLTDVALTFKTQGLGHFVFVNEDTTDGGGPALNLYRKNAGEADNDTIGVILFTGHDSSPSSTEDVEDARTYGKIRGKMVDVSDGSADGQILLSALVGDSHKDLMRVGVHEDDDNSAGVALYRGQMIDHGSSHTLTEDDEAGCYIRATAAITLTLPASPAKGEQYVVISDHAGTTTISANGSDTMNGSTTNQTITTRYEAKTFIAVSTSAWIVIG